MVEIKKNLVPTSKYDIKCPYSMTPIGITVHNTANDASAKNEINYMISNNAYNSFHYAVDDKEGFIKDYFEAARTLGANEFQLVYKVAIPHAMPSILQGCTQAMSSSCVALMIAEMLGVKAGLGWYMTWQTGWASYDKVFAALFVICLVFTVVTKGLERIKRYVLRWQNGGEK